MAALSGTHLTARDLRFIRPCRTAWHLRHRGSCQQTAIPHGPRALGGLCEKDLAGQPSAELLSLQSGFLLNPIALFFLDLLFSKRKGERKVKTCKISR